MKQLLIVALVVMVAWMTKVSTEAGLSADQNSVNATIRVVVVDESSKSFLDTATVSVRSEASNYATLATQANTEQSYIFHVKPDAAYDVVATTKGKIASQSVIPKSGEVVKLTLTPLVR